MRLSPLGIVLLVGLLVVVGLTLINGTLGAIAAGVLLIALLVAAGGPRTFRDTASTRGGRDAFTRHSSH